MARPVKLNEEIQKKVVDAVRAGNYLETAAAYSGLDVSTVRRWVKRGEREIQRLESKGAKSKASEKKYIEFCTAIKKASAESEMRDVLVIGNAAKEAWQAAAWRLERKYPDRWGRKDKHEVTGKDGGPIEVEDPKEKLLKKLNEMAVRKEQDE